MNQMSPNSKQSAAFGLGTVSGPESWTGLSIQQDNDEEWFSFTIGANGLSTGPADSVAITFDPTLGQLNLKLLNQSGNLIDSSAGIGGSEVILAAGHDQSDDLPCRGVRRANPDYTLTVTGPGRTAVDAAIEQQNGQSNNASASAFDLGTTSGAESIGPLSLLNAGENDWFKFTIPSGYTADSSDFVGIVLDNTLGDLDVQLFNSSHDPQGAVGDSLSDFEQISLAGLSGGTYYVDVSGHNNATNPEYDLVLQTPDTTAPANIFGPTPSTSSRAPANLQTIDGVQTFSGLSIGATTATSENWFSFSLVSGLTGLQGQSVSISYDNTQGNLTLSLYNQSILTNSKATPLGTSSVSGDQQTVSLAGLTAAGGPYYIEVSGGPNPNYTLTINAPQSLQRDSGRVAPRPRE